MISVTPAPQPIREWRDVDAQTFREEIESQQRPAVLRGLVRHWPAVKEAASAPAAICRYLRALDSGREVDAIMTPPEAMGRIFYDAQMDGFNFLRNRLPLSAVIDQLQRYAHFARPPAVAVQSALVAECVPGFLLDNRLPLLDERIAPRLWLGNAITTPAHFDESNNIACVVSGRRRFTLFPPEQIGNLYVGPLDFAPTGTPISLVSFSDPDFDRFPRFRDALAAAQIAELGPGDALYIPALWWHHVQSLNQFNALVNYWWHGQIDSPQDADSALDCLLHCLISLKGLPPAQKAAWGVLFNHYLFDPNSDAAAHIPAHRRGVLGDPTPETLRQIRQRLKDRLLP
jgi:hypothetical protein